MYFDLNVPVNTSSASGKGKGKAAPPPVGQINDKIEILVHLGYTVIALCQTVNKKIEKNHVNFLDEILPGLKKRDGVLILKRLNIILDSDSEKGFGLINAYVQTFNGYDLISLVPTTQATFSQACLTHSQPSPLTAHIISLPLTLSRLPFHLKHTLIRTAIRNGAVFEINYVGALGAENDPLLEDSGAALNGTNAKRNWWASTRELCRVTKGKGIIVSGGASNNIDLRAPRDVGNIISLLGIPQNLAHDAMSAMPKSITIRAQTRMSYRAILSEPVVIIPPGPQPTKEIPISETPSTSIIIDSVPAPLNPKKRSRQDSDDEATSPSKSNGKDQKHKKKKQKSKAQAATQSA